MTLSPPEQHANPVWLERREIDLMNELFTCGILGCWLLKMEREASPLVVAEMCVAFVGSTSAARELVISAIVSGAFAAELHCAFYESAIRLTRIIHARHHIACH